MINISYMFIILKRILRYFGADILYISFTNTNTYSYKDISLVNCCFVLVLIHLSCYTTSKWEKFVSFGLKEIFL